MTDNFVIGIGGNMTDVSIGNTATSNTFIGKLVGNADSANKVNNKLNILGYEYDGSATITINSVPISAGGTGATSASGARTNLGAVAITGDTMTGKLTISGVNTGLEVQSAISGNTITGIKATRTDLNKAISIGVNESYEGIYSSDQSKWLLRFDGNTTYVDGQLPLIGGTMTGAISKTTAGGNWIAGRNNATLKNIGTPNTGSWYPTTSQKTPNGSWEIGSLKDDFYFSYSSDADFEAGNNVTTRTKLTKDGVLSCSGLTVNNLTVNGNPYHQTYYGTTTPDNSLGVNGDIYIKYNA